MSSSSKNVLEFIKETESTAVDFRFTDLTGQWHHMTYQASAVDDSLLENGVMFDGSSIPGWKSIQDSDMLMKPDLSTAVLDPFAAQPTLILTCDVYDPTTNKPYDRDPRSIAKKAEEHLKQSGIADTAYFGPEPEFFIFDDARFDATMKESYYHLDSVEGPYNSGKVEASGNMAYRPHLKGGYFPVQPTDRLFDLRAEMLSTMAEMGLVVEKHHHEVAPSQHELGFKYGTLTATADALQIYKYVIRNVAFTYGKSVTFMPKPIWGDNGSGMHVHQSLWKDNNTLFAGGEYAGLSETALYYIGGIIAHGRALNAFTNPTTNSYKRLVPGYEAPVVLAYSARNRSVAIRIPYAPGSEKTRRIEVRFPDPMCNGYLGFAAMLMAGLDGIKKKIHPGQAMEGNLYDQSPEGTLTLATSLQDALVALDQDRDFLKGVFSDSMLDGYIALKQSEALLINQMPHPGEFKLYYSL